MTRLGSALRALGGLGGSTIGSLVGYGQAGGQLGTSLGASLSKWLGSGDYSVSTNTLVAKASTGIPSMHNTGQKIVVRHKEFLGEIRSNQNFTVVASYSLNPGLSGTFPWLSRIAACYQTYSIKGMVFHYVPTSGMYTGTTPALGSVMIQTSYRATDTPPSSKVELLNEYWSSEAVPSEAFCHPIECNPKENPFQVQYVRGIPLPSTENQLMYDLGTTHVAVSGQVSSNVVLGDMWVTYEIELSKPVLDSSVAPPPFYVGLATSIAPDLSAYLGTSTATSTGTLTWTQISRTLTIPATVIGTFYVYVTFEGSQTVMNLSGDPAVSGVTIVPLNTGNPRMDIVGASSTGELTYAFAFRKTSTSASTIALPVATWTSGTITAVTTAIYGSADS